LDHGQSRVGVVSTLNRETKYRTPLPSRGAANRANRTSALPSWHFRLGVHETERIPLTEYFPIFRVPEYSELLIRTDSRSRWYQERGVAELGIFLAANLAPVVEAYCSSPKFESVREDARISRGSCSNQGTGAGAHSDSEFPNALIEGRRCAARPFSPRFNIPSPSE
jgi:hypothetical protein